MRSFVKVAVVAIVVAMAFGMLFTGTYASGLSSISISGITQGPRDIPVGGIAQGPRDIPVGGIAQGPRDIPVG